MTRNEPKPETPLAEATRTAAELRAVLDSLPLATAIKDREGNILYANRAAAPGYGASVEEMIGGREQDLLPEGNDVDDVLAKDRQVIDTGRSLTVPGMRFRTRDGRKMVLHMTRDPIVFEGAPAVLVTAMDVTVLSDAARERRRIERRMAEAQRLEGLGLMAGGIAHDFNNLLVGVIANAELAQRNLHASDQASKYIAEVKAAGDRLAGLTRQMLQYSGRGHVNVEPVDLSPLVEETLQLLRATIPPGVEVEIALERDLPKVDGDRSQLGQVIMNLVTNAAEAVGEGPGSIQIATRFEFLDVARTSSLAVRALRGATTYVCLEVRDDGPGMDPETRNRIFDPFFTTKGTQGRGLGLASVLGIVRAHQAGLQVDSSPSEGTTMRVWLPPSESPEASAEASPPVSQRVSRGQSVLVVDDEDFVRKVVCGVLELRGFTVHSAEDGDRGVAVAEQAGRVDVVVLDMTMPGRPVEDTHRALRSLFPDAPVLLMSGYNEPRVLEELLADPATEFIQKPFTGEQLVERLGALLT